MVKVIKLVTGEEIVGDISRNDLEIVVTKPCAIVLVPSKSTPDQHSMALIPYAGYAKDHTITLKAGSIIWEADLQEDVYNQYNMLFGTGIQILTGKNPNTSSLNVVSN